MLQNRETVRRIQSDGSVGKTCRCVGAASACSEDVHCRRARKLHPRLLAVHIVEFAFGAMSCAVLHLFAALFGAMEYTLRGSWPEASIRDQIDRRET